MRNKLLKQGFFDIWLGFVLGPSMVVDIVV
jgi:hypothetical protein